MSSSMLLADVISTRAVDWSMGVGSIMVTCNLFAFVIGRYAIKKAGSSGVSLPGEMPAVMQNFGLPELLAVGSFGHILGVGMILGLSSAGLL